MRIDAYHLSLRISNTHVEWEFSLFYLDDDDDDHNDHPCLNIMFNTNYDVGRSWDVRIEPPASEHPYYLLLVWEIFMSFRLNLMNRMHPSHWKNNEHTIRTRITLVINLLLPSTMDMTTLLSLLLFRIIFLLLKELMGSFIFMHLIFFQLPWISSPMQPLL